MIRGATNVTSSLLLVGIVMRLTIRDRVPGLAVVYYALPPVILCGLATLVLAFQSMCRRWRSAAICGLGAMGLLWWTCADGWFVHPTRGRPGEPTLRVVAWNCGRGRGGWARIAERLPEFDADLIAIVEAGDASEEMRKLWKAHCPDYDVSLLGGGIVCLTRGATGTASVHEIDGASQLRELEVVFHSATVTCLIVDVHANPFYVRRSALEAIARRADEAGSSPVLVLGDFNTPPDSAHFASLREKHVRAFERSGAGFHATWPAFAPVLPLDQIWGNQWVDFRKCRLHHSKLSDHCAVVAEISVGDQN